MMMTLKYLVRANCGQDSNKSSRLGSSGRRMTPWQCPNDTEPKVGKKSSCSLPRKTVK